MKAKSTGNIRSLCLRLSAWFKRLNGATRRSGAAPAPQKSAAAIEGSFYRKSEQTMNQTMR